MPSLRLALVSVFVLASPAVAGSGLEAQRAQVEAASASLAEAAAAQDARRDELLALSRRLEALKAASRGRLLPGGELDASLKRSQELSAVLTSLAQQRASREAALELARQALVSGLGEALTQLQSDFELQPAREVRSGLLARMRQLRAEREVVRAALPRVRLPTAAPVKPSDDPLELLEQADQLRDDQQRAQRALASLEARLTERRHEAALDRRVQRFLGEASMFDDQDRRLRVQRTPEAAGRTAFDSAGGAATASQLPGAPLPAAGGTGTGNALPGGAPAVVSGADARPQLGRGPAPGSGEDDDVATLERERAALARLVDDLTRQASEVERRARELK